jgi:hypothetical protein
MSLTSLSIIMAVIVSSVYEKTKLCTNNYRVPKVIRHLLFNRLVRLLCMETSAKKLFKQITTEKNRKRNKNRNNNVDEFSIIQDYLYNDNNSNTNTIDNDPNNDPNDPNDQAPDIFNFDDVSLMMNMANQFFSIPCHCDDSAQQESNQTLAAPTLLEHIKEEIDEKKRREASIKMKNKKLKKEENEKKCLYYAYEWILAALILDRLLFWIFIIVTITSYVSTIYIIPHYFQDQTFNINNDS